MRRGCISLGNVRCDDCQRVIPHSGPYFIFEEEGGMKRLCQDCSLAKDYAHYKEEKGGRVLTFFSE